MTHSLHVIQLTVGYNEQQSD